MADTENTKIRKGIDLQDNADQTKELTIQVDSSATTGTKTTIQSTQTANRTLSLPDATDTLMGRDTTDTVTNKSIDADFNALTNIADTNIASSANIALDKLAALNTEIVPVTDGSGFIISSTVTATELQALSGISGGDIQTQLDAKMDKIVSTDNAIPKFDSTGGNVQNTGVLITDTNRIQPSGMDSTGNVDITDSTSSTTDSTGALTVTGGVGIGENLNVGGNAIITGDLTVNGTTTTINTDTLDVEDANITINKNGNQASANNTAGITVEMSDATDASIIYDSSTDSKFRIGEAGSEIEVVIVDNDQKISNKRFSDNNTIRNDADNAKVVSFDLSPATSSTFTNLEFNQTANRNIIFPDADTTLIGQNETVDVENKTLITTNEFADGTNTTKRLRFNLDPATDSTIMTIEANQTASRNVILPDADTNLIGNDTTDTLSNKTFSDELRLTELGSTPSTPSSGIKSLYAKTDGKLYTLNDAGLEQEVGSGSDTPTSSNYFDDFESNTIANVSLYDDGSSVPVDGSGGSPSLVSTSLNTSTPISRDNCYTLTTNGTGDSVGEGFAIETNVDFDDFLTENGVVDIQFNYRTSGSISGLWMNLWVYKVGSNTLEPLNYVQPDGTYGNELKGNGGDITKVVTRTSISSSDTAIRILFHNALDASFGFGVDVDRIFIGKSATLQTNTTSGAYTPTVSSTTNVSASTPQECRYTQVDDVVTVFGSVSITPTSTSSNTQFNLSLPITPKDFTISSDLTGAGEFRNAAAASVAVRADTANDVATFQFTSDSSGGSGNVYFSFSYNAEEGVGNLLNSTEQLFQNANGRFFRTSSSQSIPTATNTKVQFNSTAFNNNLDFSSGVGDIEVPSAGRYFVHTNLQYSAFSSSATLQAIITVNGSNVSIGSTITDTVSANWNVDATTILDLNAGDVIAIEAFHNSGSNRNIINSSLHSYVVVSKLPDLEVIGNAGVPDEYIQVDLGNSVTTTTADTYLDAYSSSFDIDLTPGTWEIGYDCMMYLFKQGAGSNTTYVGNIRIFNVTDSVALDNSVTFGSTYLGVAGTIGNTYPTRRQLTITITEDKTYRLQIRNGAASSNGSTQIIGGSFTGALTEPDAESFWYARRIR